MLRFAAAATIATAAAIAATAAVATLTALTATTEFTSAATAATLAVAATAIANATASTAAAATPLPAKPAMQLGLRRDSLSVRDPLQTRHRPAKPMLLLPEPSMGCRRARMVPIPPRWPMGYRSMLHASRVHRRVSSTAVNTDIVRGGIWLQLALRLHAFRSTL